MVPTPFVVQSRCHPPYPCSSCSGQVPARPRVPTAATAASPGGSHHRCSGSRSRRSARRWSGQSGPLCAGGRQDTPRSEALRLLGVGGEEQMGRTAAKVHGPDARRFLEESLRSSEWGTHLDAPPPKRPARRPCSLTSPARPAPPPNPSGFQKASGEPSGSPRTEKY